MTRLNMYAGFGSSSSGPGVSALGPDSQHTLHPGASVWLGDVRSRHAVDHHHHPLHHHPLQRPATPGLRSLAAGGTDKNIVFLINWGGGIHLNVLYISWKWLYDCHGNQRPVFHSLTATLVRGRTH